MQDKLTVIEHLSELRKRIAVSIGALIIAAAACFPFSANTLRILKLPAAGYIGTLAFFNPQDAFTVHLKIAFLLGFIIVLPLILFEFWSFISPAMEEKFKKYTLTFILFCLGAFVLGCVFSYFILLPAALKFLLGFAGSDLEPVISAQNYISFVLGIMLGSGLVFQMPVLSFILTKVGLVNYQTLKVQRKFAIPLIFIIAAVITPTTDAFNLLILAIPMLLLYELSIHISRWTK